MIIVKTENEVSFLNDREFFEINFNRFHNTLYAYREDKDTIALINVESIKYVTDTQAAEYEYATNETESLREECMRHFKAETEWRRICRDVYMCMEGIQDGAPIDEYTKRRLSGLLEDIKEQFKKESER